MKASEAKNITEQAKKGNRLPSILRNIQKSAESGAYNIADYLSEWEIIQLTELGYKINVTDHTRLPFGNGNKLCDILWYDLNEIKK